MSLPALYIFELSADILKDPLNIFKDIAKIRVSIQLKEHHDLQ